MSQQKSRQPWVGRAYDVEFVTPLHLEECQARLASVLRFTPNHPQPFTGEVKGTQFFLAYAESIGRRGGVRPGLDARPRLIGTLQATQHGTYVQATFRPHPTTAMFVTVCLVACALILLLQIPNLDFIALFFQLPLYLFFVAVAWAARKISRDETLREPLAVCLHDTLVLGAVDSGDRS